MGTERDQDRLIRRQQGRQAARVRRLFRSWQTFWRLSDWWRQRRERGALTANQAMGRKGEDLAHRFLRAEQFEILARRFRLADGSGEIDIIAREADLIVFIEVKTRRSAQFGGPERAIGGGKERNIIRTARSYVLKSGADWSKVRFDIITVVLTNPPVLTHYRDAFFPGRAI